MTALRVALLGVAASVLMSGTAMAADLIIDVAAEEIAAATNWDGLYVGVQGGYDSDEYVDIQGVLGVNFTVSQSFLLGAELAIGPYFDVGGGGGDGYEGYVAGRAGFAVDSVLLYGLAGASIVDGDVDWVAGVGAEFMVTDSMSLRGQVLSYAGDFYQANVGAMWHF